MPRRVRENELCLHRIQTDLQEFGELKENRTGFSGGIVSLIFPDEKNPQRFVLRVNPTNGMWAGHNFEFEFVLPNQWPVERPRVRTLTRIWHPNVSEMPGGGVCVSLLRPTVTDGPGGYTPQAGIKDYASAILFVMESPNPYDTLNAEAGRQFLNDPAGFQRKAEEYCAKFCPA